MSPSKYVLSVNNSAVVTDIHHTVSMSGCTSWFLSGCVAKFLRPPNYVHAVWPQTTKWDTATSSWGLRDMFLWVSHASILRR